MPFFLIRISAHYYITNHVNVNEKCCEGIEFTSIVVTKARVSNLQFA